MRPETPTVSPDAAARWRVRVGPSDSFVSAKAGSATARRPWAIAAVGHDEMLKAKT